MPEKNPHLEKLKELHLGKMDTLLNKLRSTQPRQAEDILEDERKEIIINIKRLERYLKSFYNIADEDLTKDPKYKEIESLYTELKKKIFW